MAAATKIFYRQDVFSRRLDGHRLARHHGGRGPQRVSRRRSSAAPRSSAATISAAGLAAGRANQTVSVAANLQMHRVSFGRCGSRKQSSELPKANREAPGTTTKLRTKLMPVRIKGTQMQFARGPAAAFSIQQLISLAVLAQKTLIVLAARPTVHG